MLMRSPIEYNSSDFTVSYDSEHDIIRLSNKEAIHFSYEDLDDFLLIMIDDETDEVIGAQMFNFISNEESTLESINRLDYKKIKKALYKSLKIIQSQ